MNLIMYKRRIECYNVDLNKKQHNGDLSSHKNLEFLIIYVNNIVFLIQIQNLLTIILYVVEF